MASSSGAAPKCHPANRAFHDHLDALRLDAGSKGFYSQQRTYAKALQALRRYPLPLRSPQEVADLEGMGKACCRIFEECRQSKKSLPSVDEEEVQWRTNCKKRLAKALKDAAKGKTSKASRPQPLRIPRKGNGKGKGGRGRGRPRRLPVPAVPALPALQDQVAPDDEDLPLCQLVEREPFRTPERPARATWSSPKASPGTAGTSPLPLASSPLQESSPVPLQSTWPLALQSTSPLASQRTSPLPLQGSPLSLHSTPPVGKENSPLASQSTSPFAAHASPLALPGSPENKTPTSPMAKFEFQGGPRRSLRRSSSAPEAKPSQPKRRLVQTRSEPLPPRPPRPRLGGIQAALEVKQCSAAIGNLVLLLDHREVGASKEHTLKGAMFSELQKRLGPAVEARSLPLGDVLWIWRNEITGEELVSGWIVERKTFADLSASICDGRYDEQKGRLLEAPNLRGVIFLVEGNAPLFGVEDGAQSRGRGFGQRLGPKVSEKALATSATNTQLISGFNVLHSASIPHSISLLVALHNVLARDIKGQGDLQGVSYQDFAERTQKHGRRRVFEAFGRMLRMVPGCGAEATEAMVDEFQTPQGFAAALRDSSDAELLARLKQRGGRVTQPVLQHCRRLYCGA